MEDLMKEIKKMDIPNEIKEVLFKVNIQVLIAYTEGKNEGMKIAKDIFTK